MSQKLARSKWKSVKWRGNIPDVLVTGPMGCGTHLVCDLLADANLSVRHDDEHGTAFLPALRTIIIVREQKAAEASVVSRFGHEIYSRRDTLVECAHTYRQALWITYEQLCDAPESTIKVLADYIGIKPWTVDWPITNQNAKWKTESPVPQTRSFGSIPT